MEYFFVILPAAAAASVPLHRKRNADETGDQDPFARDTGCRYGQGFLYFSPLAQDQGLDMLRKSSPLEEDT